MRSYEEAQPALRPPGRGEARAIGILLVAAGCTGLLSVALPHPASADALALALTALPALLVGLLCWALATRVPLALSHALLALAPVLSGAFTYEAEVAAGIYGSILVWATMMAAYFFPRRIAIAHLAWTLAVFAATLALVPSAAGFSPFTRWLFVAFSLTLIMVFVSYIVARRAHADRRARSFFDLSQDMLCTLDSSGRIVEVNDAWERNLGYAPEEMLGRYLVDLAHPEDRERAISEAIRVFEGKPSTNLENRVRAKDGSLHWLRSSAALAVEEGMLYARATDVTELKRVEAEREELLGRVEGMARSDPLTGLPNRRALNEQLPRQMAQARRVGADLCLAIIDLDRFKSYNDTNGHLAGDELLRECAIAWDGAVRGADLLVRFGGEEFLVVLPETGPEQAEEIVERLRAATPGGQTCSAGMALWDGVEDIDELLARADAAMYEAKAGGRDRLVQAPRVAA
jgi:diguanylate cyclase (GGDEF)-like protein/PAS domain S-box-containing protein